MCGIAGYFSAGKGAQYMSTLLECVKHRGPDDIGYEVFPNVGIGQTRLAIIDLSPTGHQPMFSKDKKLVLVFNGEIYNYQDVKKELAAKYEFMGTSDTEVLIYAYKEWGVDCLQKLNGMFSFALYDREKDLIFGARDRLGEKPFKYFYDGKDFIFSSEIKAILKVLPKKPEMDLLAISDYLTLQYIPTPKTGFKNIFKLPAAHYFIYKPGNLTIKKYWQPDFTKKLLLTEKEWKEMILAELDRAVRMRMIGDVPVGALLSGGVDSSAVVAFMAKNSSNKIKTFSIGFDDPDYDESYYAEIVAQKYDTDHTKMMVSKNDLISVLPKVIDQYDEPIADNSTLPTYVVSQLTSKHVKVALAGDGGDENFGGYERYNFLLMASEYNKLPGFLKAAVATAAKSLLPEEKNKLLYRLNRFLKAGESRSYSWNVLFNMFLDENIRSKLLTNNFIYESGLAGPVTHESFYQNLWDDSLSLVDNAMQMDILTYLPDDLLYKTDIASMAHGLELRAPLLDHEFMGNFFQMPSDLKVNLTDKKILFKKALVDGEILPENVVYRRKRGFVMPIGRWLREDLSDFVRGSILSPKLVESGYFNVSELNAFVNRYLKGNPSYNNEIFSLIVLGRWFENHA
uniref:asparagine synthase (glutamine-hydrolyzing) n=1 Tax=candidate division WWE3 bacterium TaxID=2053526 RepID=A0A7C4TNW5_UNCKA